MGKGQTFVERKLRAEITLAPDSTNAFYSPSGKDFTTQTKSFSLPMIANIQAPGLPTIDSANIRIYGMSQNDMGALSFLNYADRYAITVSSIALFDEEHEIMIYSGNIRSAIPNYSEAPNVFIDIYAVSGLFAANAVLSPYSVSGTVPVSTLLKEVIEQYNTEVGGKGNIPKYALVDLVNNPDLPESVEDAYISGSLIDKIKQINQIISGTGFEVVIDGTTVYFRARNFLGSKGARPIWFFRSYFKEDGEQSFYPYAEENGSAPAQTESPDSPIIGYPKFEEYGITIQILFVPGILIGDFAQVDSIVPRVSLELVNGANYQVVNYSHSLSSRIPGSGAWFTNLSLIPTSNVSFNNQQ